MLTDKEVRDAIPDRQATWTDEQMCIWTGRFVEAEVKKKLKAFVANDSTAATFQSLGQYRKALLEVLAT